MDTAEAVEFAFEAGLKVRGAQAAAAARVSLALHAARTVDAGPFLARDEDLAARAVEALLGQARPDLALQVALWAHDARPDAEVPEAMRQGVLAYAGAKRWAAGEAGEANLAWIRDVPRSAPERGALSARLLLLAGAAGRGAQRFAAAALEAELAELPRPEAFATLLEAAAASGDARVMARTLEGAQGVEPRADGPQARAGLARLRVALEVQREAAEGRRADAVADSFLSSLTDASAPALAAVGAHLGAACARAGESQKGLEVVEALLARDAAGARLPRDAFTALLLVRGGLSGGATADPLALPAAARPASDAFTAGSCEAARALRSAAPAVAAMRLFDPEDLGLVLSDPGSAGLAKELVREGARAAAGARDLQALESLSDRLRRLGLRPQWDLFLRALLADAAAAVAARAKDGRAFDLALSLAGRGLPRFERAKMRGRAACAFVRAAEVRELAEPLVDLYFPPGAGRGASGAPPES